MAQREEELTPQQRRSARRELRLLLRDMGVKASAFMPMIQKAVAEKWSPQRFLLEVRVSKPFRRMFPGIPDNWTPTQYRQMEEQYRDIARDFGIHLTRKRVGMLIAGQNSPQEFFDRARVIDFGRRHPEFREAFNQILAQHGRRKLDNIGWANFLLRRGHRDLIDLWEAASLQQSGLDIAPGRLRRLTKDIGEPGQRADIGAIVAQVRALRDLAGPELRRAGISEADLVSLEGGGPDTRGLRQELERIVNTRRAIGQATGRQRAAQGPGVPGAFPGVQEGR